MRFLAFLVILLTITGLAWLLVAGFVVDLVPGGWSTIIVIWALSVAPLFVLMGNMSRGGYPSALTRLLLFRFFWYAQLLMLPLALGSFVGFVFGLPFGAGPAGGRLVVLGGAPLLVAAGLWGYWGTRQLVVRHIDLRPARMPRELDGLRVVQLSDLHVGPHTSKAQLKRIADAVREARPDILAYTGDQVDDYPRDIDVLQSAFGHLDAPLGRYAIAGNHDVYAGWADVRRRLEAMGLKVLVNDSVELAHKGARFWLAGTGDPAGAQFVRGAESGAPDIDRTLARVPKGAFCITLAHNPALFPALAQRGVAVTLSGHTHYGQFAIPSKNWSLASVFLEYAMGEYERGDSLLYISPGANFWGIPFRIGTLPEVSVITLRAT